MSKPTLKAYGETHGDDGLLLGILSVITEAAENNCKICFVEQPPEAQVDREKFALKIMTERPNPHQTLSRLIEAYDHEEPHSKERAAIREWFISVACSFMGIRVICADVSIRDPMLDIRSRYVDFAGKMNGMSPDEIATALGCPIEKALTIAHQLTTEHRDGIFMDNTRKLIHGRLSEDPKVTEYMLEQMQGASAVAIYGKSHLEFSRPDSLASTLRNRIGKALSVFNIDRGSISEVIEPTKGHPVVGRFFQKSTFG